MATEPNKVIYSMVGVSKYYDKRPILKNIYLSYFLRRQDRRDRTQQIAQVVAAPHHGARPQGD
jgi:hypothetical protein